MYRVFKRVMDILVSVVLILALSPILVCVALILFFSTKGPVFYLQERVGKDSKFFQMFKFSTMLPNSINMGSKTITIRNDPRVTRVGKVLRISKINELPQLFNILRGDMSFIGPRPLIPTSFRKYRIEVQEAISKCVPGLSGAGSIIFRDEEDIITKVKHMGYEPLDFYKNYIYPYKGAIELWYSENISFTTDIILGIVTLWKVLFPQSQIIYRALHGLPALPRELTEEGLTEEALISFGD
ncbi:MAG: sugar transferase [Saprospiraceae bacterium]|nr:sugar transferase [Saprospiraceae bacterium]